MNRTTFALLFAANAGLAAAIPGATFTQITDGPIVTDSGVFTRCAWSDFNGDGYLDLIAPRWADATNLLYVNRDGTTFDRFPGGPPMEDVNYHVAAVWGDYNNDGFPDLFVSAGGQANEARNSSLFHNNADGTFTVVDAGGISTDQGFFNSALWADYDNDGLLDLLVADNGNHDHTGGKIRLWRNRGDGTFERAVAGPVTTTLAAAWGACWWDYDGDGRLDLLIVNFDKPNHLLYHNEGGGNFTRSLDSPIASDRWPEGGFAAAAADYDNDGRLDLLVTGNSGSRLYHNEGGGRFSVATSALPGIGGHASCAWGDFDNDGHLDLLAGKTLFRNNGNGTFSQASAELSFPVGTMDIEFNSASWVDYDNDGQMDLFLASGDPDHRNLLYRNNGNSNGWLHFRCVGTASNRSAIGAKVRVESVVAGQPLRQLREISHGGGANATPLVAYFGLGTAPKAGLVRIEWPSGSVQELHDVAANQILTVTEPPRLQARLEPAGPAISLHGGRGFAYELQVSTNLLAWTSLGQISSTNLNGISEIEHAPASGADRRFYRAIRH